MENWRKEIEQSLNKINVVGVERAILTLCFDKPDLLLELEEEKIEANYFTVPAHKFIFLAMNYLYQKSIKPTPDACLEVIASDDGKKAIEEVGEEYILSLSFCVIPLNNFKIFVEKLKQAFTRTHLVKGCIKSINELLGTPSETKNPLELLNIINQQVADIQAQVTVKNQVYKFGDNAEQVLKFRAENPSKVAGLELGGNWNNLDYYTQGAQKDDLIVVCGRSKAGKSVLLTNWAVEYAVKQKLPILYISTEMSDRLQEDRILAMLSDIPISEITTGLFNIDTDYGTAIDKKIRLDKAVKELKESKLFHVYMPNYTPEKVIALTKQYKLKHDIVALFFDYIKVTNANDQRGKKEYEMLGFLAMALKDLGGELEIPVYTAVQENRNNPKTLEKDETNVGGSDRILQNASKLIFLIKKSEEMIAKEGAGKGTRLLQIAYQRNGAEDIPFIHVEFLGEKAFMREI